VKSDFSPRATAAEAGFGLPMYPVRGTRPTHSSNPPGLQTPKLFAMTRLGLAEFKACVILRGQPG